MPLGPGPLAGIKVVELGVWIAGPATGGLLADWGADVVKIEGHATATRHAGFMNMFGGEIPFNPPFELDNRSKRSIVIDLANPVGLDARARAHRSAPTCSSPTSGSTRSGGCGLDPRRRCSPATRGSSTAIGHGLRSRGTERDRAAYDIGAFWARCGVGVAAHPAERFSRRSSAAAWATTARA